jgi:tRNA(His) 5'-end guanylyltransferase
MNETMKYLCQNVQGCKFGFTQSDEISLLLTDYDTLTTDAWFDYNVQKMCSIVASMATLKFSQFFRDAVNEYFSDKIEDYDYHKTMCLARDKGAMFDARCFNIPANEVRNYFIWRQSDGTRNAINMLGRTYFSDKQMHGLSTSDVQEKLFAMHGINFNDMPVPFKRGMACVRVERPTDANPAVLRKVWHLAEPCIFTNDVNFIMAEI